MIQCTWVAIWRIWVAILCQTRETIDKEWSPTFRFSENRWKSWYENGAQHLHKTDFYRFRHLLWLIRAKTRWNTTCHNWISNVWNVDEKEAITRSRKKLGRCGKNRVVEKTAGFKMIPRTWLNVWCTIRNFNSKNRTLLIVQPNMNVHNLSSFFGSLFGSPL